MDIEKELKDKFDKEVGIACVFEEDYPPYTLCFDHSHHVALYNMKEFPREIKFEKFSLGEMPEKGYVLNKSFGYRVSYIKAAKDILNPNEYGFESLKNVNKEDLESLIESLGEPKREIPEFQDILYLKKGSFALVIAPRIFRKLIDIKDGMLEGFPVLKFDKVLKKTSSSVMVW